MPYDLDSDYIQESLKTLSAFGDVVKGHNLKEILIRPSILFRSRFDVIIVNWIDDIAVSKKTGRPALSGVLLLLAYYVSLRLTAKKLIFVRHNVCPHHTSRCYCFSVGRALDLVEKLFSLSITHSPVHAVGGRLYVPHPLFGSTLNHTVEPTRSCESEPPYYVAFGRVLPYKQLDMLLDHLGTSTRLIILGSISDKTYLENLKEKSKGKRVEFITGSITTERAMSVVANAHGVVLSAAGPDMVVSGSMFFALGLGVRVFAIRNSFMDWCLRQDVGEGIFLAGDHRGLAQVLSQKASDKFGDDQRAELRQKAVSEFGRNACHTSWAKVFSQL